MLSARLRSETGGAPWRYTAEPVPSFDHYASFISALFSGGDSRIAADPITGLNKYLCPEVPAPDVICASSCTASPISVPGFDRAARAFTDIVQAPSPRGRVAGLNDLADRIKARLLRYFDVGGLARVILCPSGTDAMLTAAMLIAAERPAEAMTAILPSASETGAGVPMAATCCLFEGPDSGTPLNGRGGTSVEIPLRLADGSPRSEEEVNDAFATATKAATGHVVVYLTHGTKTGLIAPTLPPVGTDVIVDACQARIEPVTVAAYLTQGWPVVVTGSKFLGGPAFSGAVLLPRARKLGIGGRDLPPAPRDAANLGTALRWTAALAAIDAFEPQAASVATALLDRAASIERALASNPALVPIRGLQPHGRGWAGLPSIFTFGVRDPMNRDRLLPVTELRPLYERLARLGVLLGQPVGLGTFGGLRIAVGARDLLDRSGDGNLRRIFAALAEETALPRRQGGVR